MSKLTGNLYTDALRVLYYFERTKDLGLTYEGDDLALHGMTDSDCGPWSSATPTHSRPSCWRWTTKLVFRHRHNPELHTKTKHIQRRHFFIRARAHRAAAHLGPLRQDDGQLGRLFHEAAE